MHGLPLSLAVSCVGFLSGAATGQVLYSTLGPGDSYSTTSFTTATFAGYGKTAVRFAPSASGEINQVETVLARSFGSNFAATLAIVPEVMGSNGAQPGLMPVWCSTAVSSPVDQRAMYTFTGPHAALTGGQNYWLVLEATDNSSWYWSSPLLTGTMGNRTGSQYWTLNYGSVLPAVRISLSGGASSTGACCNPATGSCTLLAATACASLGLSYSGNNTACSPTLCTACPGDFNHSGHPDVQDIFDFLNAWFASCP